MNIGYFVYNFDNYSGAAFQAKNIALNINKKHNIYIFSINKDFVSKKIYKLNDNIEVINLPRNKILQCIYIMYYVKTKKIEIFHLHGFITIAMIIARILDKKILLKTTLMGHDDFKSITEKSKWLKKIIVLYLVKKVDKNIALSREIKKRNNNFLKENKIKIIHNGVIVPNEKLIRIKKDNVFCIVGMICERKRTYESIKYFIDNYINLKDSILYVVGPLQSNLDEFDNKYLSKCINLARDYLDKKIIFTDKLNKDELNKIYNQSKCIILFSKKEGMPNVILESMAYNVVPLITELDGVSKEIIDNEIEGFIINNFSKCIEIDKIDSILFSKLAYMKIKNNFDIKKIAFKYERVYYELQKN